MFRSLFDHLQVYLYIGPVVNCHVSPTLAAVLPGQFRLLESGSPRRLGFNTGRFHVILVVAEVARSKLLCEVSGFGQLIIIPPLLSLHLSSSLDVCDSTGEEGQCYIICVLSWPLHFWCGCWLVTDSVDVDTTGSE
jgi:hypothetical protein